MASVPDFVVRNCIDWNTAELNRADRDSRDNWLPVPNSAVRRIWREGKPLTVRLTTEEYRAVRAQDARRYRSNIASLEAGLTTPEIGQAA